MDQEHECGIVPQGTDAFEIFLVDYSPTVVRLFSDMLEGDGYRIRTAGDGREALQSIAKRRPDLVLLDVMMPELDGYEVCQTLWAQQGTTCQY